MAQIHAAVDLFYIFFNFDFVLFLRFLSGIVPKWNTAQNAGGE